MLSIIKLALLSAAFLGGGQSINTTHPGDDSFAVIKYNGTSLNSTALGKFPPHFRDCFDEPPLRVDPCFESVIKKGGDIKKFSGQFEKEARDALLAMRESVSEVVDKDSYESIPLLHVQSFLKDNKEGIFYKEVTKRIEEITYIGNNINPPIIGKIYFDVVKDYHDKRQIIHKFLPQQNATQIAQETEENRKELAEKMKKEITRFYHRKMNGYKKDLDDEIDQS